MQSILPFRSELLGNVNAAKDSIVRHWIFFFFLSAGSWCAEHKHSINDDKDQYLQFDLGKQMTVDAIATQGSHLLENWIRKYNLRYSDDAKSWQFYAKVTTYFYKYLPYFTRF